MKTAKQFIREGGCPCCGESLDLYYDSFEIDAIMASQRASCYNCGLSWWEIYEITGYEYNTYKGEPIFVGINE